MSAMPRLRYMTFYARREQVGDSHFEIDQSLAVQHQARRLADRVVPGEIALGHQITFDFELERLDRSWKAAEGTYHPEILQQRSKGRHDELLILRFSKSFRPCFDVVLVLRNEVSTGIDVTASDVCCPELLSRLEMVPDCGRSSVVLQNA